MCSGFLTSLIKVSGKEKEDKEENYTFSVHSELFPHNTLEEGDICAPLFQLWHPLPKETPLALRKQNLL